MKKLVCFCFLITAIATGFAQNAKHVILISVDGFRPDFYLDSNWQTPTLHTIMKKGAYAKGVNSVFPSMTYPSHTTMITGVQPAKHGVYFNNMFEPNGPTGKMYWNDSSIHSPTLWQAVEDNGGSASSVFWPVSAGAPVHYNIPDIGSMGEAVRVQYTTPPGFIDTLKADVFHDTGRINYGLNTNAAKIASYVIEKDKPALLTIHMFAVDHYEHEEGRNGEKVHDAVRNTDSGIAMIIDALKNAGIYDSTVLIVTGDHGFVDVKQTINPNVWLHGKGLCNDVTKDDWKAQFFSVGGSSYLYVKNNDPKVTAEVKQILTRLPADKKKLFAIVDRKKLDAIGANPDVPFALTGLNGTSFGNKFEGDDVTPGTGGSHGYFPDFHDIQTGFLMMGPNVNKGVVIKEMNERDINAIAAAALGISFPSTEGNVPAGLLQK